MSGHGPTLPRNARINHAGMKTQINTARRADKAGDPEGPEEEPEIEVQAEEREVRSPIPAPRVTGETDLPPPTHTEEITTTGIPEFVERVRRMIRTEEPRLPVLLNFQFPPPRNGIRRMFLYR